MNGVLKLICKNLFSAFFIVALFLISSIQSIEYTEQGFVAAYESVYADDKGKHGNVRLEDADFSIKEIGTPIENLLDWIRRLISGSIYYITVLVGFIVFVAGLVKLKSHADDPRKTTLYMIIVTILVGTLLMNFASTIELFIIQGGKECTNGSLIEGVCADIAISGITGELMERIRNLENGFANEFAAKLSSYFDLFCKLLSSIGLAAMAFWIYQLKTNADGTITKSNTGGKIATGIFAATILINFKAIVELTLQTVKALGFDMGV